MLRRCRWKHRSELEKLFIERSKKRIEQFDVERAPEVQRLEESQKRLEELLAMVLVQQVAPQPVDASADGVGSATTIAGPSCTTDRLSIRSWMREDYVPATEEEVLEWLADRQEDMNTAHMAGNPVEAARISGLITDATRSLRSHRGGAIHGLRHGQMIVARRSSRYGLRGVRVGEASNPGPQLSRQRSHQPREHGRVHSSCQSGPVRS